VDRHGSTAMHWAAGAGHVHVAQYLLEQKASLIATQQKDRRQALHWAARNGRMKMVQWLLEQGVDVDVKLKTAPQRWVGQHGKVKLMCVTI